MNLLAALLRSSLAFAGALPDVGEVAGTVGSEVVAQGDSLIEMARRPDLGFAEIAAANPGLDPFVPAAGTRVVLPTAWIVPQAPAGMVLVNLSEMRLYLHLERKGAKSLVTFPIGVGVDGHSTPPGGRQKSPEQVGAILFRVNAELLAQVSMADDLKQTRLGGHGQPLAQILQRRRLLELLYQAGNVGNRHGAVDRRHLRHHDGLLRRHLDHDLALDRRGAQIDRASGRRVAQRVVQQVHEHALDQHLVDRDERQALRRVDLHLAPARRPEQETGLRQVPKLSLHRAEPRPGAACDLPQVEGLVRPREAQRKDATPRLAEQGRCDYVALG